MSVHRDFVEQLTMLVDQTIILTPEIIMEIASILKDYEDAVAANAKHISALHELLSIIAEHPILRSHATRVRHAMSYLEDTKNE